MAESLVIAEQFCGPPGFGNGGYVCGRLAAELAPAPNGPALNGPAEVTLRKGAPLGRALTLARDTDGVTLHDGAMLIGEARPAALALDAPAAPSFEQAARAQASYPGFHWHAFPRCFGCGPERGAQEGLRVMPAPVAPDLLAAAWVPDPAFADPDGAVRPEFLWTALDCPGGWAVIADAKRRVLLGRLAVRLERPVRAGERCVVTAWRGAADGRKLGAGSALFGADGRLAAIARATWFAMAPEEGRA